MRKRISITIRSDILHQVDSLVDGINIRTRSHALETLLEKALGRSTPDVLVLAGDDTCVRRLGGTSVIENTLKRLKSQGFEKVAIGVVSGIGRTVMDICGDGSKFGLDIRYIEQGEKSGTASALHYAKGHFSGTFLVIYGDNLFNFDLRDLVAFHKSTNNLATVALTTTNTPNKYGVAKLQGSKIVAFDEKPGHADTYMVSTGIFVFEPKIFDYILPANKSLESDVLVKLIEVGKLSGYVMHGFWSSLSAAEDLEWAERELRKT